MKSKIIILIISITALWGCESWVPKEEKEVDASINTILIDGKLSGSMDYEIVIIDSCEYIIGRDNRNMNTGYSITHKGNCKNPIHKLQQQIISANASLMNKKREDMISVFKALLTQKGAVTGVSIPFNKK